MLTIINNKTAKWEGFEGCQGPIREDQIFPNCFLISENLPILLFILPICFLIPCSFPVLLFYRPVLLYYAAHLLLYSSCFAFLSRINLLIIRCFCCCYFIELSNIYKKENSLPAFMWGGYPEPGGDPIRRGWIKQQEEEERGQNGLHGLECKLTKPAVYTNIRQIRTPAVGIIC